MAARRRVRTITVLICGILAAGFAFRVSRTEEDPKLPFLANYHVIHRPTIAAGDFIPAREVLWIEAPMSEVRQDFRRLSRVVNFENDEDDTGSEVNEPGYYAYNKAESMEAWFVVPGKANFPHWPDDRHETVPGTEATWTTVLYARSGDSSLFDRVARLSPF